MINGWTIRELEPGWNFRFEAERGGYAEKFYSRAAAEDFTTSHH